MHAIRKTLIVTVAAMALLTAAGGMALADPGGAPQLHSIAGLPPGVNVTIPGTNGNPPMINWGQAYPFTVSGLCPNGVASFTIEQNGAVIASGPMAETPKGSGTFTGTIPSLQPDNQGNAQVTVTVTCPNGSTQAAAFAIDITAPAPPVLSCSAAYSILDSWSGGFQGQVLLTNTGNSPVNGWTLTWTFPGNQQITSLWNGTYTQSGESVTVTSTAYDATIQPGGSVTVGFTASDSGSNTAPFSVTCT